MKERIRQVMEAAQLSQQDFANRLGISPASLSSIFTGRTNPTNNHVQAIHRAFPQININWLLFDEGKMWLTPNDTTTHDGTSETDEAQPTLQPTAPAVANIGHEAQRTLFGIESKRNIAAPSHDNYKERPYCSEAAGERGSANIFDKPIRREIKEIRVFFDDGTYEAFVPSSK